MALNATTVASAIAVSDTIITLTSGTGAAVGSNIKIDGEEMTIQDISQSPTLGVERGQNKTASAAHNVLAKATIGLPSDFATKTANRGFYSYAANGALTPAAGTTFLNQVATTGVTFTLAAPTKDQAAAGIEMEIIGTAAVSSTVTNTTPGFNNGSTASDVATFTGIGDTMSLRAGYAGTTATWFITNLIGVTVG